MKRNTKFYAVLALFLLGFALKNNAQQNQDTKWFPVPYFVYQIFDKDSLSGFDNEAARTSAISEGFLGQEFKVRMFRLKREYINNKYNLYSQKPSFSFGGLNNQNLAKGNVLPGCTNEDFEATTTTTAITVNNQINGWTVDMGSNLGSTSGTSWNSCNLLGCCALSPTAALLINAQTGYIDPVIGASYPIYSVFGSSPASGSAAANAANTQVPDGMMGSSFIRINDNNNDFSIHKLSKTFSVTPSNAVFQFAFISVFYPGHGCCDAGAFSIKLFNGANQIPCPTFTASALSSACTNTNNGIQYLTVGTNSPASTSGSSPIYNKWQLSSLDLTPYIGQSITVNIVASDCTGGGHYGYVYFDAQCGPMVVKGNGIPYSAGSGTVLVPTCGAAGATICAPSGLGPYAWTSNQVNVGNFSQSSFTNTCFTSSVSATFTITMGASACPITRVVSSTITPAPALNISSVQAVCGVTTAIVSVTAAGSLPSVPSLTWFPPPLNISPNGATATYTLPPALPVAVVSVSTQDAVGCKLTVTANVYPAPPIPTFTFTNSGPSQSITCALPTVSLNAVSNYSYNGSALNYTWNGTSNVIQGPVANITIPGIYSVSAVDPITQCGITQTVAVYINTLAPSVAVTPSNMNITCLSAATFTSGVGINISSPTVNVTSNVTSPNSSVSLVSSANQYTYLVGGTGIYTINTVNNVNGCSTSKIFSITSSQTFPTFNLVSPQNFTLGCGSTSIANIQFANPNSGSGAPLTYTILSGSMAIPSASILSSVSNYTVNTAGIYTLVASDNGSGCKTILPITVLNNKFGPKLDTLMVSRKILDCNNPSVTLRGVSSTPSVSYLWNYSPSINLNLDSVVVNTNTSAPTNSIVNNYTLTLTDGNNLCITSKSLTIYQCLYAPTPSITGKNVVSCKENNVVLTNASKSNIPTGSIFSNGVAIGNRWSGPTPQVDLTLSSSYTAQVPGVYTLEVKDLGNGCKSITNFTVLDNFIYPVVQPDSVRYLDCGASVVTLSAGLTSSTQGTALYDWLRPEGAPAASNSSLSTFSAQAIGRYIVTVTDPGNGCASSAFISVKNGTLTVSIDADQSSGFAPLPVKFTNNSRSSIDNNNIRSVWSFGNGKDTTTKSVLISPTTIYSLPGNYYVKIYVNKGSCIDSVIKKISVDLPSTFEIPNVFTPNGDGINDFFFLKTASLETIDAYIYDRWGRLVFKTEASTTGNISWDGKNASGKESPDGTYFYVIKAKGKDGKDYNQKGSLNLTR